MHKKRGYSKRMAELGKWLLETAEAIRKNVELLDTAVRDEVSQGLAYIVQAGNDCTASNLNLTTDQWMSFIDHATAEWFRRRGYAEWFCIAAGCGFRKSRRRTIDELAHQIRKRRPRKQSE